MKGNPVATLPNHKTVRNEENNIVNTSPDSEKEEPMNGSNYIINSKRESDLTIYIHSVPLLSHM